MSKHIMHGVASSLLLAVASICHAMQDTGRSPPPLPLRPPTGDASLHKPPIQCVRWPCGNNLDSPIGHVVKQLYRDYPTFYSDPEPARKLLSEGMFALLQKDAACADRNGMCAIGADPWITAQDGDRAELLEYRNLTREKDIAGNDVAATVELCFGYMLDPHAPEKRCVVLTLTRQPHTAWKVDDLISPDGQSLRDTLQHHPYE